MANKATLIAVFALLIFTGSTAQADSDAGSPIDIARRYFEAMSQKNLDAAGSLFAERSSIFETGRNEGDWAHYKAHHIGAELDAIKTFDTKLGEAEVEISGERQMALVAWPLEYHIILRDEREIYSRGSVTFVLTKTEDVWKIRHLHWSSRRIQQGDEH